MNAIIFCNRSGREDASLCLTILGGEPVLGHILHGLDRLGLTKMIFIVDRDAGPIKRFLTARARGLSLAVAAKDKACPDSLTNLACALRHVEATGIYILDGRSIFSSELLAGMAGEDRGAVACVQAANGEPGEMVQRGEGDLIARIGNKWTPGQPAERDVGLYYLPRVYLAALRGAIVALTAAGGADAPFREAINFLIQRGLAFKAFTIAGMPFAELHPDADLAQATAVALNLRGGGRKARPLTG